MVAALAVQTEWEFVLVTWSNVRALRALARLIKKQSRQVILPSSETDAALVGRL
jgi:hypothetical protein